MKYRLFICFVCLNLVSCAITGKSHQYTGSKHTKGAMRVVKSETIQHDLSGIIYGNVQTEARLKNIDIYKLSSNGKIDKKSIIRVRTFSNGNFIAENLQPGHYIISSIYTRSDKMNFYALESETEFYSIEVREGEAVYAGTYRIMLSKLDDKEQVKIKRSAFPTEMKILRHVSVVERHTIWSQSLRERMSKLI